MLSSPKPGTDTWRVLALIVTEPGEPTSKDIAARVRPAPKRTEPFGSTAEYGEWRRARLVHEKAAEEWASRVVRRLAEAGLLEKSRKPVLASWFPALVAKHGGDWEFALRKRRPGITTRDGSVDAHLKMLRKVAEGPTSVAALLGPKPDGWDKRVWADLCQWGVAVPPSRRWATARGIALIEGQRMKESA